jgi:hypothetical protein
MSELPKMVPSHELPDASRTEEAAWERNISEMLEATTYPEQQEGAGIDKAAYNIGLLTVLKAVRRGEFQKSIVKTTHEAFEAMVGYWKDLEAKQKTQPGMGKKIHALSNSSTGQLLCATIYQLTKGSLVNDEALKGGQTEVSSQSEQKPFQLRWFTEAATLLDQLRAENSAEKGERKYFLAPVNFDSLAKGDELKKQFGFCDVAGVFDGRPFELNPACEGMDVEEGMRIMCLRTRATSSSVDTFIKEESVKTPVFAPNGFRPGTERDIVHFSKVDPDKTQKNAVVALGATARNAGAEFYPVVGGEPPYYSLKSRAREGLSSAFSALFIAR